MDTRLNKPNEGDRSDKKSEFDGSGFLLIFFDTTERFDVARLGGWLSWPSYFTMIIIAIPTIW